jgi:hypothetical protein
MQGFRTWMAPPDTPFVLDLYPGDAFYCGECGQKLRAPIGYFIRRGVVLSGRCTRCRAILTFLIK